VGPRRIASCAARSSKPVRTASVSGPVSPMEMVLLFDKSGSVTEAGLPI
jgi:hypothetical protein